MHAIGDAGVRTALDARRAGRRRSTARATGVRSSRTPRCVDPADLPRFAELGVVANLEPLWAQLDPLQVELTAAAAGSPTGPRWQYPMASLLASGARAVDGQRLAGQLLPAARGAGGRRHPADDRTASRPAAGCPTSGCRSRAALSAYTQGVAYQAFEEDRWGPVPVGRRADLVWLAADPAAVDPLRWPGIAVRGTWLGGDRTWAA